MAIIWADRVGEITSGTGTGALALSGALTTYQTFASGVGNGNTCYYSIVARTGGKWEVGYGTITLSGAYYYLSRTTPQSGSSGAGVLVDFDTGIKEVKLVFPAAQISVMAAGVSTATVMAAAASAYATQASVGAANAYIYATSAQAAASVALQVLS